MRTKRRASEIQTDQDNLAHWGSEYHIMSMGRRGMDVFVSEEEHRPVPCRKSERHREILCVF